MGFVLIKYSSSAYLAKKYDSNRVGTLEFTIEIAKILPYVVGNQLINLGKSTLKPCRPRVRLSGSSSGRLWPHSLAERGKGARGEKIRGSSRRTDRQTPSTLFFVEEKREPENKAG